MTEWFLIIMLTKMTVLGPFTEDDCQRVKRMMFGGHSAICVDRRLIDAKLPA